MCEIMNLVGENCVVETRIRKNINQEEEREREKNMCYPWPFCLKLHSHFALDFPHITIAAGFSMPCEIKHVHLWYGGKWISDNLYLLWWSFSLSLWRNEAIHSTDCVTAFLQPYIPFWLNQMAPVKLQTLKCNNTNSIVR